MSVERGTGKGGEKEREMQVVNLRRWQVVCCEISDDRKETLVQVCDGEVCEKEKIADFGVREVLGYGFLLKKVKKVEWVNLKATAK